MKGKKATMFEDWPEVFTFTLLIFGFLIALWSGSAFMNYIIIFLVGMLLGRMWWQKKNELKFPLFLMSLGFVVGFILGSFYGDKKIIFLAFVVGFVVSQQLHKEGYIDW